MPFRVTVSTDPSLGTTVTSSVPLLVLRRGISHCCVPGKVFALSSVPLQQSPLRESVRHLKCPDCDARNQARQNLALILRKGERSPAFVQSALQVLINTR